MSCRSETEGSDRVLERPHFIGSVSWAVEWGMCIHVCTGERRGWTQVRAATHGKGKCRLQDCSQDNTFLRSRPKPAAFKGMACHPISHPSLSQIPWGNSCTHVCTCIPPHMPLCPPHPQIKPRKARSLCRSPKESRQGQSRQCSGRDYRCCPWQPASGFPGTQNHLKWYMNHCNSPANAQALFACGVSSFPGSPMHTGVVYSSH